MLAAIHSAAVVGIDAYAVTIEVDSAQGLPQWTIVGLPAGAVKESRDRVAAALVNSGFTVPPRRLTVNLAPADTRKEGTAFDLPIALGVLVASGQLAASSVQQAIFVGELGLDGSVRPVRGALSLARHAARYAARCTGAGTLVLPAANVAEAARVPGVKLAAPATLAELVQWLRAGELPRAKVDTSSPLPPAQGVDWADVIGQPHAKRALEIAAAGGHNLLLVGPPKIGRQNLSAPPRPSVAAGGRVTLQGVFRPCPRVWRAGRGVRGGQATTARNRASVRAGLAGAVEQVQQPLPSCSQFPVVLDAGDDQFADSHVGQDAIPASPERHKRQRQGAGRPREAVVG